MIMILGPAGSGKSTQAELLAAELGRVALSVGQICREQFAEYTKNGDMVPELELARVIVAEVAKVEKQGQKVVLDAQPWGEQGVAAMVDTGWMGQIELVLVLDVPREECLRRLAARGRADDRAEVWHKKLDMFEQKIYTFLTGLAAHDVEIIHINGVGEREEIRQDLAMSVSRGQSR